ncbi:MAG: aspartyl protease family protein [Pyrinomonadaceae bacterium]
MNYVRESRFPLGFFKYAVFCVLFAALLVPAEAFGADDVKKIDFSDIEKLVKQAKKHARNGETKEAEQILKGVIASNPNSSLAKLELALLYVKSRNLMAAYNYAADVVRADPKNSYGFAVLGTVYLAAGNFADAKMLLENSLSLENDQALAWASLGLLDYYENRLNSSLIKLKRAFNEDSKEPDYPFALAQVSARAERYKEAAEAYEDYLRNSGKGDQERRERILGLIRFLRYLGRKTALYQLSGAESTSIDMNVVNNRPIVEVRIKKKGEPLRFVLDTGSGISVISNETAKRLNIKPVTSGGSARALGGDGKFDIVYGFLKNVYLGEVQVKNVPVYIREFHNTNEKIDGYVGVSLISKYLTTIDYGNNKFSLLRKDSKAADTIEKEGNSLPLRLTSSGFLSGIVKLDGIESPLNFIVDTGASVSVIDAALADSSHISPHALDETFRVVGAAGITENVPSFLLPRVSFGTFSRDSLKAIALDLNLINESSGFTQAGILGGNFLRNYSLTFDFRRSKVTFTPHNK